MNPIFAKRLNKMIEIRKVNQNELSIITGIPKSVISRYVNGKYIPKHDNLISLSKALKCNPAFLIGETEEYEDFDGLKLVQFVKSTTPEMKNFEDLTIEERHCAFIYGECKKLSLEELEEVESYIEFIKSKSGK